MTYTLDEANKFKYKMQIFVKSIDFTADLHVPHNKLTMQDQL